MSRLTRDGTAETVSRDQNLRHGRGQGNIHFPCSADHEQDWQLYPVDPYSVICDDHTYIDTYIHLLKRADKKYWSLELSPTRRPRSHHGEEILLDQIEIQITTSTLPSPTYQGYFT